MLPADHAARERVRHDLDATLLVEAGAGTGKTTILVERIVAAVKTGRADVDSIVVITFTEKAAAELSARVREGLEDALEEAHAGSDEHRMLHAALHGLYRARIETIHAFATSLLRERPVEARLDPQFQVLDDLGAKLLFDEVYDEWLEELLRGSSHALELALNRGFDLRHLRETAEIVNGYRDALPLRHLTVAPLSVNATVLSVSAMCDELRALTAACTDEDDRAFAVVQNVLRFQGRCTETDGDPAALERAVLFRSPRVPGTTSLGAKGRWEAASDLDRVRELLGEIRDQLAELQTALRAEALVGVLPLVEELVGRFEARRRERGRADFDDLLIWARDLLRDDLGVRAYFQRRYSKVFIDEFQDTDPVQAELALLLTSDGQDGTDWQSLKPAPGKLFLVGDPKQSIYRFRRADIAIYDAVKTGSMGGNVLHLTQNFRSQQGILEWVNILFERVFGKGERGIQAANVDLDPWPNDLPLAHTPVIALRGEPGVTKADAVRKGEGAALARAILRAVETEGWLVRDPLTKELRPAAFRDVAILVPSRTGLELYEEALTRFRIPFRHDGARSFFERQEVRELTAILEAIDDPTDQISIVAALRSSAFACSDEDVFLHAAKAGRVDYRYVDDDGPAPVVAGLKMLGDLHRQRRGWSLAELVRQVLDQTGLAEFALARDNGAQAAANVLKLVEQARAFSASGGGALRAFTQWLAAHRDEEVDEVEASVAEDADDVVRLLTIHAAKGLEYPIACLANLNSGASTRRDPVPRPDENRIHFNVGTERSGRFGTPGFDDMLTQEKQLLARERERLLYVAATRARDHLIVPMIPRDDKLKGMLAHVSPQIPALDDKGLGGERDGCWVLGPVELGDAEPPARAATDTVADQEVEAGLAALEAWRATRDAAVRTARTDLQMTTASSVNPWDGRRPMLAADAEDSGSTLSAAPPRELGDALHHVMERASLEDGADLSAVVNAVTAELGLEEHQPLVEKLARRCLGSEAVRRAVASGAWHREVPFMVPVPGSGYGAGRMDLIFREDDELVVVDYKSDNVAAEAVDEALEHHRAQAAVYAVAVEQASGLRVREVVFMFARPNLARAVAVDEMLRAEGAALLTQGVALPIG